MSGVDAMQGALDRSVERATASLSNVHHLLMMGPDDAMIGAALVAIADQLQLANTLTLCTISDERGVIPLTRDTK